MSEEPLRGANAPKVCNFYVGHFYYKTEAGQTPSLSESAYGVGGLLECCIAF